MVKLDERDVKTFIEDIKSPRKFLEYCKFIHEGAFKGRITRKLRGYDVWLDDVHYAMSLNIIQRDYNNIDSIKAGAKIIAYTWNWRYYATANEEIFKMPNLESAIESAYKECKDELDELKSKKLIDLDLDGEDGKLIRKIYKAFSDQKSIRYVGASKILHIINPNVFMMWDTNIQSAYHLLHKGHSIENKERCYLEFLKQSQDVIREILKKMCEDELWNEYSKFLPRDLISVFDYKATVLKMLDECNFVRFTIGKIL